MTDGIFTIRVRCLGAGPGAPINKTVHLLNLKST